MSVLAGVVVMAAASLVAGAPQTYVGMCEASAAIALDDARIVVASDDSKSLFVYTLGKTDELPAAIRPFSGALTDIEGAARVGDTAYWITSHSFNKNGKDKAERKIFLTSRIEAGDKLAEATAPFGNLRDALAEASGVPPETLNVEGLAAADGKTDLLYAGLRSLKDGKAVIVPLSVKDGVPRPGEALPPLDLDGLGIRSLERVEWPEGHPLAAYPFLIVAGTESDANDRFALYGWAGPAAQPEKLADIAAETGGQKFVAEALVVTPDSRRIFVLGDNGDQCAGEDDKDADPKLSFPMIELTFAP